LHIVYLPHDDHAPYRGIGVISVGACRGDQRQGNCAI
jgi:hypothetical protein